MKIKQDDGSEIEVYTADELEEERKRAVDEFKNENPDLANIEQIKSDLDKTKLDLEAALAKGGNTAQQRKIISDLEIKVKDQEDSFTKQITEIKTSTDQKEIDRIVDRVSGGDVELKKKIVESMKQLSSMPHTTDEEKLRKVEAAYKLSTPNPVPSILNHDIMYSGGAGGGSGEPDANKPSQALVDFGARYFGLTAEDFKKYGGKKYDVLVPGQD